MIDAIPAIDHGRAGRRRRRPAKVHADKGYDVRPCRRARAARGIKHRIVRVGVESKTRMGSHRCVVERTFDWLAQYRRLSVRYERRADLHRALLTLGCSLICWKWLIEL